MPHTSQNHLKSKNLKMTPHSDDAHSVFLCSQGVHGLVKIQILMSDSGLAETYRSLYTISLPANKKCQLQAFCHTDVLENKLV